MKYFFNFILMFNYIFGSFYIFKNKLLNWTYTNDIPRIEPKMPWYRQYSYFYAPGNRIMNGLYLGSSYNAYDWNFLISNNINVIINLTHEIDNFYQNYPRFTYYKYRIHDNNIDDIEPILRDSYTVLNRHIDQGDRVLVHCFMGASRSASVVIYYLMNKHNFRYEQAKNYVISQRPLVNLSFRFDQTLRNVRLLEN
jgi:hypothetical protein